MITFQNIDTLERVAGIPEEKLVEAHGSFHTAHCVVCRKEYTHEWVKGIKIHRGYYTVARRYEFYVQVARTIYCSCHENIKFISSSQRVMFFFLYGETNSTKQKAGIVTSLNDTTLTKVTYEKYATRVPDEDCGVWNLRVVQFPAKHSPPYNKPYYLDKTPQAFISTWI